jgi:hypothetical protein
MRRNSRGMIASAAAALFALGMPASGQAQTQAESPSRVVARDVASELACGPRAATSRPITTLQILGGEERGRAQFAPGDRVVINAGSSQGLQPGQKYFIRRIVTDPYAERLADVVPVSIQTAGWLTLVEVQTEQSVGTVTKSCDSIHDGDYLEPFTMPSVPAASPAGEPDFAHPGHVLLGGERRQVGATGGMMVLDRGSDHGLRPGQQLTIFRTTPDGQIVRVGEATTVTVSPETSTIRLDYTRDAVYVGDRVAIHR